MKEKNKTLIEFLNENKKAIVYDVDLDNCTGAFGSPGSVYCYGFENGEGAIYGGYCDDLNDDNETSKLGINKEGCFEQVCELSSLLMKRDWHNYVIKNVPKSKVKYKVLKLGDMCFKEWVYTDAFEEREFALTTNLKEAMKLKYDPDLECFISDTGWQIDLLIDELKEYDIDFRTVNIVSKVKV